MQLKSKKHIVDTLKSEPAMNKSLVKSRGDTVTLVVFEYGTSICTQQQLEEFVAQVIRPEHTDRAGTVAEQSFRDVVAKLQEMWSTTFHSEAVVWRMWATHVTRNTTRTEWDDIISQPHRSTLTTCFAQRTLDLKSDWRQCHDRHIWH